MFSNIGRLVLDLIYGARCIACDRPRCHREDDLCDECLKILRTDKVPRCTRCGCRLGPHEASEKNCPRCRSVAFRFRSVRAAYSYEGTVRHMILAAKLQGRSLVAKHLADRFVERFRNDDRLPELDIVIPVPMHWFHERLRGMNMAQVLGSRLAEVLGMRTDPGALVQTRPATPQRTLVRAERLRNVLGLYAARKHLDLKGQSVLLVDDVLTTGATATECTRMLKGVGAREVHVAVLARTEPDRFHKGITGPDIENA